MDLTSSANAYAEQLIKLAPTGECWPTDLNSTWVKLLNALAQEFARVDAMAYQLYKESNPATSEFLIENWEKFLGLPKASALTLEQRQHLVAATWRARGGQSTKYYEDVYSAYGYSVTVQDASPFIADLSEAGGLVFDEVWSNVFIISCFDAIADVDKPAFEALLNKIKPANTSAMFTYI